MLLRTIHTVQKHHHHQGERLIARPQHEPGMSSLLDIATQGISMETAKRFFFKVLSRHWKMKNSNQCLAAIKQNPDLFQKTQGKAVELALICQSLEEYFKNYDLFASENFDFESPDQTFTKIWRLACKSTQRCTARLSKTWKNGWLFLCYHHSCSASQRVHPR